MKNHHSILATAGVAAAIISLSVWGSQAAVKASEPPSHASEKPLQIVATIFPEYDWVKELLGDFAGEAKLTLLLDNGADMHSFQPSVEDIMTISSCDLFLYVGGESDQWVEEVLEDAENPDLKALNLLEILGDSVKEEELVEGMREEEHEHESEEEAEYDEHVWLSLKNAQVICEVLGNTLAELDPEHGDAYLSNASAYQEKLSVLDEEYQAAVHAASQKTLLFADRFPFRYLMDDYGLSYYAAFSGCSAEAEASFETIIFLVNKVDELGLNSILTLEKSDQKLAKTVVESTKSRNQQILTLDSLQSTTSGEASDGVTYLSVMESNLEVLKEALK